MERSLSPDSSAERVLAGKVVVITGGSRGIGRAIASEAARCGALAVVFNSRGDDDNSRRNVGSVLEEIKGMGVKPVWVCGDVAESETADRLIGDAVNLYGRVDVVVNNAGITADGLLVRMSDKDWDRVIRTNLYGPFFVTRAALRQMIRQRPAGGSIVFVSSVVAEGNPGQANYAAAKAGMEGLARTVAMEYESRGVKVAVIAPGLVQTDMAAKLDGKQIEAALAALGGRMLSPQDIAREVVNAATSNDNFHKVVKVS